MSRGVKGIDWSTKGTGLYEGLQFRDFFNRFKYFEQQRGFFTRAFETILHRIEGIKIGATRFSRILNERSVYDRSLPFKKVVFSKEIDYELAVILLSAVKAYVMAAWKNKDHTAYWKVGGGGIVERELTWVNLTKLPEIQRASGDEIRAFKRSDFYRKIVDWLRQPSKKMEPDPDWLTDYQTNDFYRSIIDWMEKHGLLEYFEKMDPPIVPPPVTPPPPPRQGNLFG